VLGTDQDESEAGGGGNWDMNREKVELDDDQW
jgi:hypothetical protein